MKKLTTSVFLLVAFMLKAQVGVGTDNPDASAILELKSDNKEFLLPRVDPSDINNPADGLLIYNSAQHCLSIYINKRWYPIALSALSQNLVSIPDANFRSYLKQTIPEAFPNGGDKMDANSVKVRSLITISVNNKHISSLEGIQYFTALTLLECYSNQLRSLNLSGCTALTQLFCSSDKLASLDVSGCTALTDLDCSYNNLTSLNVQSNTALTQLNCSNNRLNSLDLSHNCHLTRGSTSVSYDSSVTVTWCSNP